MAGRKELQMECGDSGTRWRHRTRGVREMLSYWCCFWRASGNELHCWKLRVLPSSLFISSRWAFFSASMASGGNNEKWGIRLCQLHEKHTGELAKFSPLQVPRSISADSLFLFFLQGIPHCLHTPGSSCCHGD